MCSVAEQNNDVGNETVVSDVVFPHLLLICELCEDGSYGVGFEMRGYVAQQDNMAAVVERGFADGLVVEAVFLPEVFIDRVVCRCSNTAVDVDILVWNIFIFLPCFFYYYMFCK